MITSPTIWISVLLLLPLLQFLLLFFSKKERNYGPISALLMAALFCLSIYTTMSQWNLSHSFEIQWLSFYDRQISFFFLFDNQANLMLLVVFLISTLVSVFSTSYMKSDPNKRLYYAYLGLFVFSMVGIIFAADLLLLFVFWELVGFSSYLLIGFWRQKKSASIAASKAFIVNRVGDAGFLVGIMIFYVVFQSTSLTDLQQLTTDNANWLIWAGLGIFAGVVGKSAQFPLFGWLPDAMEGPTPVSALIHAATMVAAGIYMLARFNVIFQPEVLHVMAFTGAVTAFMAAFAAVKQYDIKKVLAYSTISQLGFMVMAMGAGGREVAFFHLITHAFFKAGLFLCAGSVIYGLHKVEKQKNTHFDAQDMRLMGGLKRYMPFTFLTYVICAASLAGIPFFSGFLSKDAIMAQVLEFSVAEQGMYWLVILLGFGAVFLTPYYMGRQLFLIFFSNNRNPAIDHQTMETALDKSTLWIKVPLIVLSVLSLFIFYGINPFHLETNFILSGIGYSFYESPLSFWAVLVSVLLVALAIVLSYRWFGPKYLKKENLIKESIDNGILFNLSYHGWFLDAFYKNVVVKLFLQVGRFCARIEKQVIDKIIDTIGVWVVVFGQIIHFLDKYLVDGTVNAVVFLTGKLGGGVQQIQSGRVQSYIIWSLLSVLCILLWMLL